MKDSIRIGFDAKRLFHNRTGLGNYSRTLVRNLRSYLPNNPIYLFTPSIVEQDYTEEFLDSSKYIIINPDDKSNKAYWRSYGIASDIAKHQIDIFHGLSNELPFKRVKGTWYVATIHDLIFKEYPSHYKFIDRIIYDKKTKNIIRNADHIIAISNATRIDIERYYNTTPGSISVIYQSCEYQQQKPSNKTPKSLLYVSSITERKNLLTLLKAINRIEDKELRLHIVGSGGKYRSICEEYAKSNLGGRVIFYGNADYTTLNNLFATSKVLVYPSIKEGFGIPIIEGMQSGMYVITTRASSMVEAGGDVAYYVDDAYDDHAWANRIQEVSNLPSISTNKYRSHLNSFEGELVTKQLVALYEDLLVN